MKLKFILLFLFMVVQLQAQTLNVSVSLQAGHLTDDQQELLVDLSEKIEEYYNNHTWIDEDYETVIDCNVNIIIETVQKKSFERMYKAQFLISSASGENFYDKTWEFPYEINQGLEHSKAQFDPLTHFLDFYAYMVLAGELDTYDLLLGTSAYDVAQDIASQGLLSPYARGWQQRNETLEKITHIRTRPLRETKPDFFEALYLFEEGKIEEAHKYAVKVLDNIKKVYRNQPNNYYLRIFFEAHHKEIADLFADKRQELEDLTKLDSKHRETYRKYLPR